MVAEIQTQAAALATDVATVGVAILGITVAIVTVSVVISLFKRGK